jgi:hypothetical protein
MSSVQYSDEYTDSQQQQVPYDDQQYTTEQYPPQDKSVQAEKHNARARQW